MANALALGVDGGVVITSPPVNPTESMFAEIEARGPVRALVPPNAFHHMGLSAWKARYPDAQVFAPAQAVARVERHAKLSGIRPVAEAAKLLGDRVEIIDMPHYKTGEVLVRWHVLGGFAWYVTDVIMHMPKLPGFPFGLFFKWTKSAPGLRRNRIAATFMVNDRRVLYAWLTEQAQKTPPGLIVACHGEPTRLADLPAEVKALLAE
jgi:hypothetical protein